MVKKMICVYRTKPGHNAMNTQTLSVAYICVRLVTTVASSGLTASFIARFLYGARLSDRWVVGLFATSVIGAALCAELKVLNARN